MPETWCFGNTLVLKRANMRFWCGNLLFWNTYLSIKCLKYSQRCSWDTFIVYVKVFVAMDAIAVAFILISFLAGCLLSRNTTGQFAQAKRIKFIKVLIGTLLSFKSQKKIYLVLTAFALAADIVAEIIRILFFANLLGWEYANTWDCAVPMCKFSILFRFGINIFEWKLMIIFNKISSFSRHYQHHQ